jgi:alpha-D-ribose 1-methylphosphonate 5-triphosphate synthase subunit PhnI
MAYVAVKGGRESIERSIMALDERRCREGVPEITTGQIRTGMHFLVDRVMGEGSLYAPELAARAVQQAAGDTFEAAFMIRAYRATLPRTGYTIPARTEEMRIIRRISAAFKDVPGGQMLGPSVDYTLRLLDFSPCEDPDEERRRVRAFLVDAGLSADAAQTFPKVIGFLRKENLVNELATPGKSDQEIYDVTRDSIQFPASRSAALQTMARGETGGMLALAYSNMRGYGSAHPTIGELRVGYLPVRVKNPLTHEAVTVGEVLVTEAETVSKMRSSKDTPRFDVGYGICFGHNETKAISMATLDMAMRTTTPEYPSEDSEFVLTHIDGIESMGFANHFKLPHYVTFQSELDRLRMSQSRFADETNRKESAE